jgi:hypothetical protein
MPDREVRPLPLRFRRSPHRARNTCRELDGNPGVVTGDRFASILDPFGQRWTVMTRVEDVSAEERDRRMAEWAKDNVGS